MPTNSKFAMPSALEINQETATDTYAYVDAMPWEKGFGNTIGNALRRILLSSLEGVAVTHVRIDGVAHEFSSMPDVQEDVVEIILNLKKLRIQSEGELPRTLELTTDKSGQVTAGMIKEDGVSTILNPELYICTLNADRELRMEIQIDRGRGYRPAEQNKSEDQPIGVIPLDSLFSPVERVRYEIEACRVSNITDYDRLLMEVWTDGRITPEEAIRKAAAIMQDHLTVFLEPEEEEEAETAEEGAENEEEAETEERTGADATSETADKADKKEKTTEDRAKTEVGKSEKSTKTTDNKPLNKDEKELLEKLCKPVDDLKLSVRANNCLRHAEIKTLGQIISKSESELLKFRNFGKKSLDEIKERLNETGLSFDLEIPEKIKNLMEEKAGKDKKENEEG